MDTLKFRKRPLFRPQAVDHFIGVHGDGRMPELLHPGWKRGGRGLQVILALCVVLWIIGVFYDTRNGGSIPPDGTEISYD